MIRRALAAVAALALGGTGATLTATATASAALRAADGPSTTTSEPIGTGIGPNPSGASLRLASQSAWVGPDAPGNVLDLRVVAKSPEPAQVVVDVYNALHSRSDFDRSLTPDFTGYLIAHPIRAPLDSFNPDAQGTIEIKIVVGRQDGQLHLSTSGVYPVSIALVGLGTGKPLARFVTHLLFTAGPVTGPRLNVVWVVPVHTPPGDPKTASGTVTPTADAQLSALINALAAHPGVPVTLNPTPDTVTALAATDPAIVSRLGRSLTGREVLARTWVPMSLPAMLADGMNDQISLSLARGDDALTATLGSQVAGRTWVANGPVDQPALSFLRGSQFDRVVLPEGDLDPNPFRFTMAQPFEVAGTDFTLIRAAVADSALAAHFTNQPDQVLAAHQLLADLAQIYSDAPANIRGVVIATPTGWVPNPSFLDALLGGLEQSPILVGQQLDSFFDTVPPASGRGGRSLIRQVVTDENAVRGEASNLLPDAQRSARRQLQALASALPDNTPVYPRLERLVLQIPSVDLTQAQRQDRLDVLNAGVKTESAMVQLPSSRTITLTARKGQLPIGVVSLSDEPIKILLQVQSDKLKFPGTATATATFPLTLHKGNNLIVVTVEARTSGAFPLRLTALTPDATLVIGKTSFTVQSTALSGVGVVLSAGAALFLVVWWGRHAWRGRRTVTGRRRRRHARGRAVHQPAGSTVVTGNAPDPESLGAARSARP